MNRTKKTPALLARIIELRSQRKSLDEIDAATGISTFTIATWLKAEGLYVALNSFEERDASILALWREGRLNQKEIAADVGCCRETVGNVIKRAMSQ